MLCDWFWELDWTGLDREVGTATLWCGAMGGLSGFRGAWLEGADLEPYFWVPRVQHIIRLATALLLSASDGL